MIDLNPSYLAIVERILAEHVPECEVRAFGSRASWTAKDYSDLDLAIVGDGPLDWRTLALLKEAFEESDLPMRVDVLDWHHIAESFQRVIERNYVVLQERDRASGATDGWQEVTLGELSHRVTKGTTPTTVGGRFTEEGISFVKVESITGEGRIDIVKLTHIDTETDSLLVRSSLQEDDVLFTIAGTIGRVALVNRDILPANTNQAVAIVRPDQDKVIPLFLYYSLRDNTRVEQAHARVVQSVQANLSLSELSATKISLPPFPEQRAIAHILGTLDDKIELNRRMNETLEEMARALFRSWFVDFDPVRAKVAGEDPGLPSDVAALFPHRLVPSEVGEIPEGWEVRRLGEVVDVVGGTTPSTKVPEYWDGGVHHWATPKDLSSLSTPVLLDTERKITDTGLRQIGSGLLPAGTLLLSSRAPIGYLAVAEVPVAVNQGFIAMPSREGTSNLFMLHWCRVFHEEIVNHANGSTFLEISKSNFRQIRLVLPEAQALREFDRHAELLHQQIVHNERESRALAAKRDALLPQLVSGEVRVGEVG